MVSGVHPTLNVLKTRGTIDLFRIKEIAPIALLMRHTYLPVACDVDRRDTQTWGFQSLPSWLLLFDSSYFIDTCYLCTCNKFRCRLTLECGVPSMFDPTASNDLVSDHLPLGCIFHSETHCSTRIFVFNQFISWFFGYKWCNYLIAHGISYCT